MRAVVIHEYGPPEVLRLAELPDPEPAPGTVRIRVRAAGVQPVDCAVRQGRFRTGGAFQVRLPQIPGNEFAGVVDRIGEGVDDFAPGDEVLGFQTLNSYAEFVVVSATQIVFKPKEMPWAVAGAFSAACQTAHTALEHLRVKPGETVLIHAAAGGVGTAAVQLARARGATVIGTASAANHDYLRSLGAIPVSYGDGLVDRVRDLAPHGVDAVLDAAGRDALLASVELVENRDRIGTIVDFQLAERLGVRQLRSDRTAVRLNQLVELYRQGQLRIHIREVFPLHEAVAAHRMVERGHGRGRVALALTEGE
jgi:NADPH:quinone reductase-like Zn-dependent oxidoreductase